MQDLLIDNSIYMVSIICNFSLNSYTTRVLQRDNNGRKSSRLRVSMIRQNTGESMAESLQPVRFKDLIDQFAKCTRFLWSACDFDLPDFTHIRWRNLKDK